MESRPPIHLLFGKDRGLRDGDWKIVSLKNEPWELYNMADDRTELHDLAKDQPERLTAMVAQWNKIAKETMGIDPKPVASGPGDRLNGEWSDYSGKNGIKTTRRSQKKRK